jgi:hypothetical protein
MARGIESTTIYYSNMGDITSCIKHESKEMVRGASPQETGMLLQGG